MNRKISLLGSTGSIGRQSLEVMEFLGYECAAITANTGVGLIEAQARKFKPKLAVLFDEKAAYDLKVKLADTSVKVLSGMDGLIEASSMEEADTVITAVSGMIGLKPTLAAIDAKKRIALANKETLVCAGELVMDRAQQRGAEIIPVDSEHSALFQSLHSGKNTEVEKLIITASGGPFYGWSYEELESVTVDMALKHPNWSMGQKITIDSATMMNKGLEVIEAMRLYRMPLEKIEIAVHRQSIVHSLVEFVDGSVIAQLGTADMRLPIQYALTYPDRVTGPASKLDLFSCGDLTFRKPDPETFTCLSAALEAARRGGTACAAMNGADEVAVAAFLSGKIGFNDIGRLVWKAMDHDCFVAEPCLEDILEADREARSFVADNIN